MKAALNDQVVTFTFHVVDTTAPKPIKVTHKTTAEKSIEIFEGQTYETNLYDYIEVKNGDIADVIWTCLLYTSPSPRDQRGSRMPSSA